jgi:hypothetical protein
MNFEDCREEVSFGGEKIQISIQTTIKELKNGSFQVFGLLCAQSQFKELRFKHTSFF